MPEWGAYEEAYGRGLLTGDKKILYEEAVRRGLTGKTPEGLPEMESPVGGTFQDTGEISTITTKPIKKFVGMNEPEAGLWPQIKAGWAEQPINKIKAFSESRGIPISRYRMGEGGQVEFKDNQGKWQREVSEQPISKIGAGVANLVGDPSTYTMAAGAAVGVPGIAAGAAAGPLIKRGIAKIKYDEDPSVAGTLTDIGMNEIFGLGGKFAGTVVKGAVNRYLSRKAGMLQKAGREAEEALLTPQDHAKALWVKQLAGQHNINLAPHQLYDKEGMTNVWKYLRKDPRTSDAVRTFEDQIAQKSDVAIQGFIRDMGGMAETPSAIGEKLKGTAEKVIVGKETARTQAVQPLYERAFDTAADVELAPALKNIDNVMKGYPDGAVQDTLKGIKRSLTKEEIKTIPGEAGVSSIKQVQPKQTLLGWIRQKGGINLQDYEDWQRHQSGVVALSNKKGRGFDEIMSQAADDGWILPGMSEKDFADMIRRDIRASKTGAQRALRISEQGTPEEEITGGTADKIVKGRVPETELRKIQKAIWEINDLIEGTSYAAVKIPPSSKKNLNRELEIVKKNLLAAAEKASPEFIQANRMYESLSPPIDRLKSSIVGELSQMKKDNVISRASHKVLDVSSMPDASLVSEAKREISGRDPELWKKMIGSYVRDVYEGLRVTEEGHVVNAVGKLQKKLFGSEKQKQIMQAAMDPDEYQRFSDLMTVFQRAAIGTGKESMTAPFQQIEKSISGKMGSKAYLLASHFKKTAVDWTLGRWDEMLSGEGKGKLLKVLTSPDVVAKLSQIKRLTPGSKKFIDGFSTMTAIVYQKMQVERK
jgi:hypothetical protein